MIDNGKQTFCFIFVINIHILHFVIGKQWIVNQNRKDTRLLAWMISCLFKRLNKFGIFCMKVEVFVAPKWRHIARNVTLKLTAAQFRLLQARAYICIYINKDLHIYMYVCSYAGMNIYMYVHMYVCGNWCFVHFDCCHARQLCMPITIAKFQLS